ncbi:hypothetical protein GBF38_012203 [Nibea albiflora]|uniref:Uncharacterized protein n=1 Tax=Nibea albiflora TaxID=240163 RepID=A0ACB7EM56_NIBAL|nr:hypothetical protein GBF38_012203 [Nibea albiflora]
MSLLLVSFLLIFLLGIVLLCVIFRWLICTLAVRFFQTALNAELKIKSVGLFSVQGVSIQFHPQHTLEIDRIWISSKLLNQDLPRYLALCVGETRIRFDLQAPLGPLVKKSEGKKHGKISVSPTTLRFLSQLLSFHISSINVMVLNIALSESLWHMTITGITLLLDHQSKRLAWDFSVGQLSSKVLKSSQLDICLAEVALSLLLSGDVSLPEMKPGCLSLSVRTLIAELHEGLFLSQLLLPPSPKKSIQDASECEITEFIQTETVERFHQLIPHKVKVEFDNTNVTLSMHSQKRHLNWTLKSLKVGYGRDDEQLPLKSFTPELSFPQSSLELLLEDGLLLSQSRQRILCVNTLKTTLQVRKTLDRHIAGK